MANAIDETTNAVGTAEGVDTNISDDVFDDIDISDVEDTPEESTESTTEEESTDEAATDSDDDAEEDSDTDVEADVEETATEADEEQAPEADEAEALAERQRQNQEAAARRVAEKQAREQAKQQAQNEQLDQAWNKAYTDAEQAGFDEAQARQFAAQAMTAQQLINANYENRVMQVTNQVTGDLNQAVASIPEFRSDNPIVREAMLAAVDNFEAMYVQKDQNGDPVQVVGDLQTFLQTEAQRIRQLTGLGASQQNDAKQEQKKRSMRTPSRTPRQPKVDPDLAAFDAEASSW